MKKLKEYCDSANNITMAEGYLYCFSNPSMEGLLKVGMTERTPEIRAKELFTTGVPSPFTIEFAKKVKDPAGKEKTLHILLEQYTDRNNPRREFFRVSPEEVRTFFDLMDGEMWAENHVGPEEEEEEEEEEAVPEFVPHSRRSSVKGCRDRKNCFANGQKIRHTIGINKTWIGTYDYSKDRILYEGKIISFHRFVGDHYRTERPDRTPSANAWDECEYEVNGQWIYIKNIPCKGVCSCKI